ncbi:MAG TPA: POTRA domain-containing protein [Pyrinomonadaceae bacterium]|nr:POTRA domain-containing protein [Pyrinomonadaceae bacterium]
MRSRTDQFSHPKLRRVFVAAMALAIVVGLGVQCQAQPQTILRRIEIVGLQRLSPDQVVQSTGLRVGEAISTGMIDAAADKLLKSGLFRAVSYRIRTADDDLTVIFEVVEKPPTTPAAGGVLGRVEWMGNSVLSAQDLWAALALRSGDPIDDVKIDKAMKGVSQAYGRRGYINAVILQTNVRDAISRRTNYQFTIREGAQYRMGALTITGLGPADIQWLRAKWVLAPGAVFDDSYPETFKQNVVRPFVAAMTERTRVRSKFDFETRPDVRKQAVDVVINFR